MARCFQFLFFLLFNSLFSTLSPALQHSCPHDQSLLLLKFKETFGVEEMSYSNCYESSYNKTKTWNNNTDCCTWEGITCDKINGHVIELDVSCSQLKGTIDSESALFRLPHLRRLNLAYNGINSSNISNFFANFQHLTSLNSSVNGFTGEVPSEILTLTSLDLSSNEFTVGPNIFKLLLTNLTKLSQVSLSTLFILSSIPKNLSASLETIDLSYNNLQGKVPETIFHLPNLKKLILFENPQLDGLLPTVRWNSSTSLDWLDLSRTSFFVEIPESIRKLSIYTI